MNIDKFHGQSFDWITWRNWTFPIQNRTNAILKNKDFLIKHAIGYCNGEELICRPKQNTVAVMFLINETYQWTHFTIEEFNIIFGEENET